MSTFRNIFAATALALFVGLAMTPTLAMAEQRQLYSALQSLLEHSQMPDLQTMQQNQLHNNIANASSNGYSRQCTKNIYADGEVLCPDSQPLEDLRD